MKGPTRRPASFSMIATVCLLCFLTVSPAFAVDQQRSGAAIASFGDSSPNHLRHAQRKWNTRSGAISQCCGNLPQAKSFSLELSGAGHKNAPSRSGCPSPSSLGFGFIGRGGSERLRVRDVVVFQIGARVTTVFGGSLQRF